jgi:hypothetical protein
VAVTPIELVYFIDRRHQSSALETMAISYNPECDWWASRELTRPWQLLLHFMKQWTPVLAPTPANAAEQ